MELDLKKYISGREDLFIATNVVEMEEALTKFLEWHKAAINYTRCCTELNKLEIDEAFDKGYSKGWKVGASVE